MGACAHHTVWGGLAHFPDGLALLRKGARPLLGVFGLGHLLPEGLRKLLDLVWRAAETCVSNLSHGLDRQKYEELKPK